MERNPLASRLDSINAQLAELRRNRESLEERLDWHSSFSLPDAEAALIRLQADREDASSERAAISAKRAAAARKLEQLEAQANLGLNPRYWFSAERREAKSKLITHRQYLDGVDKRSRIASARLTAVEKALKETQSERDKFVAFDQDALRSAASALDADIVLLEFERDEVVIRKRNLDEQLKEPLQEFKRLEGELRRLKNQRRALAGSQSRLKRELAEAEQLDDQMSRATSSYERAMLHQECNHRFGESSPRAVVRDRRSEIRHASDGLEARDRQIAGVKRAMQKLETRMQQIGDRGSRVIKALIVDGNNLCYQGETFIGLSALKPLCLLLAKSYDVTVVFDATIRRSLGVSDRDLRSAVPNARIHVVASRSKADETVLQAARDPFVFILSNDRYVEYPEKLAVREGRLIRHEIINGRIFVHDLEIDLPLSEWI